MRHLLPILLLFIATNVQAATVTHHWFDPRMDPMFDEGMCEIVPPCGDDLFLEDPQAAHWPIQIEVYGEGLLAFWHAASPMEPYWFGEIVVEIPDEWDCHLSRMRFLSPWDYTEYSNVIATPEGCVPTEYVPEPGGVALLAGIGVLGLLKAAKEGSCTIR